MSTQKKEIFLFDYYIPIMTLHSYTGGAMLYKDIREAFAKRGLTRIGDIAEKLGCAQSTARSVMTRQARSNPLRIRICIELDLAYDEVWDEQ